MVDHQIPPEKAMHILLVEDNVADVELTLEALEESGMNVVLHVAQDGVEALQFLRREGIFEDAIRPDMILLDLNLPRKDGRELLGDIKSDVDLCLIPVVVLTTSAHKQDILQSYQLHANCYITKPENFDDFAQVLAVIEQFWFTIVRLPSQVI